jgi:2-polyprenyl-3-methyl-5-hydroxy-6-metoxy-1,4-benzoquinol methylase
MSHDLRAELPYFVRWGGAEAHELALTAFDQFLGWDLRGKRVLDIGAGDGRMSALFALLGAKVTGVDVASDFAPMARAEAKKWGVEAQIEFKRYSGDLASLADGGYDIAFTKSVLLLIPDLDTYLRELRGMIRPGGQVVFIENAYRNAADVLVRRLIHALRRQYSWRTPVYMDATRLDGIRQNFEIRKLEHLKCSLLRSRSSGWYLICGVRSPLDSARRD